MGYAEHIKGLLRPMRLYELDSGAGGAELSALGAALDGLAAALESAEREAVLTTAETTGLSGYEAILPYAAKGAEPSDRRRAAMALMRIDGASFTVAALNGTLSGCGLRAVVRETGRPGAVSVSFPEVRGEPEDYAAVRRRAEAILPCHLAVEYALVYPTWTELEQWFASWSALESLCGSWMALERYAGPGN